MQESYTRKYLKIYLWQGVSLVLNFLSMFVVIPYLTSDPTTYGIYSVCISFSIFLAYADLGFMGAGQKYAAEYFAKGNKEEEIKVIGFTNFILLVFLILFSIGFFVLSRQPELLVKGIDTVNQHYIASSLLLILAVFTPTTLLQRLLQMIFGIRMEDFIVQRTNIIGSVFKILSVLWFFREGKYDIVGYFLFTQIINFIATLISLLIARKRYQYNFKLLLSCIYFNKAVYDKTKGLAFASLFMTVSWILYYELDSVSIGKFLGANQVAVYAIGLTVLSFFRSIFGILFSPFNVRFNHFVGSGDESVLKSFYLQIVTILAPMVVFPIIAIAVFAIGTTKYIGLGIPTIVESFQLQEPLYVFALKMAFTIITLSAGYKGGEVTPLFYIGATLGSALSLFLPLPTALLAGMGFVAVFSGATHTPIACTVMGMELFGIDCGIYIGTACVIAYFSSGSVGIYKSQIVKGPKSTLYQNIRKKGLKYL